MTTGPGPLSTLHATEDTKMWCATWWRRPTVISVSTTQPPVLYLCFYTHYFSGATDDEGDTPLDLATMEGYSEISDYLKSLLQQCKLTTIIHE